MKKIRDYQSSISQLPGSPSTKRTDSQDLLKYNMKSKNLEPKNKPPQPLQTRDCNIITNFGDPIKFVGLEMKFRAPSKGRISSRLYDSQIVLGSDKDYMPMSNTQRLNFTNLVSYK